MNIQSVAVFCGSKSGNNPIYIQHAKEVGYLLAQKKITVIYGGGNKGIMGAIADSVLENNGKIIGIMPKILINPEHQHNKLTELHEVTDMHIRKAMFYKKCDAAIILAGGYGTLDELFEILTWNQLSIHHKKIIILNSEGFYNHLLMHLRKIEEENFLYDSILKTITVITKPDQLMF